MLHYSRKGARYHCGRLTVTKSAWQQQTPMEPEENCEKFLKEISIKMCRSCSAPPHGLECKRRGKDEGGEPSKSSTVSNVKENCKTHAVNGNQNRCEWPMRKTDKQRAPLGQARSIYGQWLINWFSFGRNRNKTSARLEPSWKFNAPRRPRRWAQTMGKVFSYCYQLYCCCCCSWVFLSFCFFLLVAWFLFASWKLAMDLVS